MVYVLPFYALLLVTAAAALRWGGRAERWAAALFVSAAILSVIPYSHGAHAWIGLQTILLVIDVALLASLLALLVWTGRTWTNFAAAFQSIAVLAHVARLRGLPMDAVAYSLMEGASSYPTVIALAVGTWQTKQREKRARITSRRS